MRSPDHDLSRLELRPATEIRRGDLVFGFRPGWFQRLCEFAGVPWRHVAVLDGDGGADDAGVVEVSGPAVSRRSLATVVDAYHHVGVARPAVEPACVGAALAWTDRCRDTMKVYAWDEVVIAGFISLTRRGVRADDLDAIAAAVQRAAETASGRPPGTVSHSCSSFAYSAFAQGGDGCALSVDLASKLSVPMRGGPTGQPQDGPSLPRFEDLKALPAADRRLLLDRYSLWELFGPTDDLADRSVLLPDDHMTAEQFGRAARILMSALLSDYTLSGPTVSEAAPADPGSGDRADDRPESRWVTPGDLWASPSIEVRFRIK